MPIENGKLKDLPANASQESVRLLLALARKNYPNADSIVISIDSKKGTVTAYAQIMKTLVRLDEEGR